jgi:GTPase
MCVALDVPTAVVVTKMDLCSRMALRETLKQVMAAIKSPPCRKVPWLVKNRDDVVIAHDMASK